MNRRFALALCGLACILAALYFLILAEPPPPAASVDAASPASVPASQPIALTVRELTGAQHRKRQAGQETALQVGEAISAGAELISGDDGRLVLGAGASRIELGAASRVELRGEQRGGPDGDVLQFFVGSGSVLATSTGDKLELFGAGTTGLVRVVNASARVLTDSRNGLVVAAQDGTVWVENAGQSLALARGQATRLLGAAPPGKAWTLPASVLLKVAWPREQEVATRRLSVKGSAAPLSLVRVGRSGKGSEARRDVLADEAGQFVVELSLNEGPNTVELVAVSPDGQERRLSHALRVDTTPADVGVETSPDMWKKRPKKTD